VSIRSSTPAPRISCLASGSPFNCSMRIPFSKLAVV
jgi:hypothetical protein